MAAHALYGFPGRGSCAYGASPWGPLNLTDTRQASPAFPSSWPRGGHPPLSRAASGTGSCPSPHHCRSMDASTTAVVGTSSPSPAAMSSHASHTQSAKHVADCGGTCCSAHSVTSWWCRSTRRGQRSGSAGRGSSFARSVVMRSACQQRGRGGGVSPMWGCAHRESAVPRCPRDSGGCHGQVSRPENSGEKADGRRPGVSAPPGGGEAPHPPFWRVRAYTRGGRVDRSSWWSTTTRRTTWRSACLACARVAGVRPVEVDAAGRSRAWFSSGRES